MAQNNRSLPRRFKLSLRLIWLGVMLLSFGDRPFGIAKLRTTAVSQIFPDDTLGDESSTVIPNQNINDLTSDLIEGGAQRGENLFHSFSQFNIEAGRGAYFANPEGIANIFSRVTGNDISNIFGTLGVNGGADLFLINPNGIIFGENASLDVNGSFLATTASGIQFGEQGEFNASEPNAPPLLTVQPSALFFNQMQPGRIESRSIAPAGTTPTGMVELFGLRVPDEENLSLIGGEVIVDGGGDLGSGFGGGLIAPSGRIELGGLAAVGAIELNENGSMGFPDNIARANVLLKNGTILDVSTNVRGTISLTAHDIEVSDTLIFGLSFPGFGTSEIQPEDISLDATNNIFIDSSIINKFTDGEGNSGDINIYAENNITLNDGTINNTTASSTFSDAGVIKITTQNLILENESTIDSSSIDTGGNAGQIIIEVESLLLDSVSFIFNETTNKGDAGDVFIRTDSLTILNGSGIVGGTRGEGNGGNIEVNASEIVLSGTAPVEITIDDNIGGFSSGFFTNSSQEASGDGGTITVNTDSLQISEGAVLSADTGNTASGGNIEVNAKTLAINSGGQILTSTFGSGDAGNVELNITENLSISGTDLTFSARQESISDLIEQVGIEDPNLTADLIIDPVSRFSGIFANTTENSTGDSGNVTIRGDANNISLNSFSLRRGGRVTVGSQGTGNAGNLLILSDNLSLFNGANIFANSNGDLGGNIKLQIRDILRISKGSSISANARGTGRGGNIEIDTEFLIGSGNSDIIANAFTGQGGFIQITAEGIFGLESRTQLTEFSDITAFSQQNPNLDGTIEIITPDTTQSLGLLQLPDTPVSTQVTQTCQRGDSQNPNEFTVTGRGGLPNSPEANLESDLGLEDWRVEDAGDNTSALRSNESSLESEQEQPKPIVEADSWVVSDRGKIVLLAKATSNTPQNIPSSDPQNCQL